MHTLIANTGIQTLTFRISIDIQDRHKQWFHEWYDNESGEWKLEPVHEVCSEDQGAWYYRKAELSRAGFLAAGVTSIEISDLQHAGISPLMVDGEMCNGIPGEVFSLTFSDKANSFNAFVDEWLPAPYFFNRTEHRQTFGPLNWARFKLVPAGEEGSKKMYDVLLAFDTRATYEGDIAESEIPVFRDRYGLDIDLSLCNNTLALFDFCSSGKQWSYVDEHLMHLVHPGVARVGLLKGNNIRRMGYVASYIFLISYLQEKNLLPAVKMYRADSVVTRDVDMVIDIGNSRTTALLTEEHEGQLDYFKQVRPLSLTDYTDMLAYDDEGKARIRTYNEPFDMRLVFRKAGFGSFGPRDSRQFVYPSFVRLGQEANILIHRASSGDDNATGALSTYSSPKRYLWDKNPSHEEWRFLVLPGEPDDHVLNLPGISPMLRNDGRFDPNGEGGQSSHYSRQSLMTLSLLEMLVQAYTQVNGILHRSAEHGFGDTEKPRRIKRVIVTCPTAMSKLEREGLLRCAGDAVKLYSSFFGIDKGDMAEVIPQPGSPRDDTPSLYYDEATCSQLVYMYGEAGHKYKGCCGEFFRLYGRQEGDCPPSLTVGSLDIGAGTTDLMISRYTYEKGDVTTLSPEPVFYDSFYFAGDDMLNGMVKNVMLLSEDSALRRALHHLSHQDYRQRMKNFFGPDHNNQTLADRILRKDFNIQYSVPLMCHFLELLKSGSKDCMVRYEDVFAECPPNESVIRGFARKTGERGNEGIDVTKLEWRFDRKAVSAVVEKEFEPLLKKVATIMYAHACDLILLSGRPASLPAVREIFLKYYPVSPDRLILLNNYYVGDWYPFGNNTGYIANPKTIVAMGGLIAHYASELGGMDSFVVNLEKLHTGLKSTVNYIEASRDGQPIEYFITPENAQGDLTVSQLPAQLTVRQLGMDTYPSRPLYTIAFDRARIADRIRRKAFLTDGTTLTDNQVRALTVNAIDALRQRMPFKLTIQRDSDDKENLSIVSAIDRHDNEVQDGNLEIHIQSLGTDDRYWLDSGAFNF